MRSVTLHAAPQTWVCFSTHRPHYTQSQSYWLPKRALVVAHAPSLQSLIPAWIPQESVNSATFVRGNSIWTWFCWTSILVTSAVAVPFRISPSWSVKFAIRAQSIESTQELNRSYTLAQHTWMTEFDKHVPFLIANDINKVCCSAYISKVSHFTDFTWNYL